MEDPTYSSLKASVASISVKALNFSSRLILSHNLDYSQSLLSRNDIARDYRGLAQLMGFQYHITKRFGELENPTMKVIEEWETRPDATLDKLIEFLEEMDRHDVIDELTPSLEKDVAAYLRYRKSQEIPVQVAEVTPGPMNLHSERSALTRDDLRNGECTIYDAYVSYADEDSSIVAQFASCLESPSIGLKLFIPDRDMLAGCAELNTNVVLIKNRCRHMLIFLTQNFIKSPALEFQVSFAGSLAIEQKQRILIPVILAPCEIPLILNSVSKIDFTKEHIQDWMWGKLITSLMPEENRAMFMSSFSRINIRQNMIASSGSPSSSMPVITFPLTAKHAPLSIETTGQTLAIASSEDITDSEAKESPSPTEMKESAANSSKMSPSTKPFHFLKTFLKKKGNSSSTSSSTSFPSGATSGFHSQSCSDLKSFENSDDNFTDDTSL